MDHIPETVFDNFIIELDMYHSHLEYVLKELDLLEGKIEAEFERIQYNYDPESTDESEVWEQATENVLGKSTLFIPYFQKVGAIAGYCIVIFHLFERFLEEISYLKDDGGIQNFKGFIEAYPQFVQSTVCRKLDELRLVANFCKHGRGAAEGALRKERPDYFETGVIKFSKTPLRPLSGYDIKITSTDFGNYVHCIKDFVVEIKKRWS